MRPVGQRVAAHDTLGQRFIRFVAERRERARRLAWRLVGDNDAEAGSSTPADPALKSRIAAPLGRSTTPQRQSFVLVRLEGFTVQEAAAIMGEAEGTVKSHLHRALQALRRNLGDLRHEISGRS